MSKLELVVSRALRRVIQAAWFVVVPTLLVALCFRYLIPGAHVGLSEPLSRLGELASSFPALLAAGLFLYFAVLIRYWLRFLPAARAWWPAAQGAPKTSQQGLVWVSALLLAVFGALMLRAFYAPYRVQSASMLPTLEPGALLLAQPSAYGTFWGGERRLPRRGDVVMLEPAERGGEPLVKRVIGLPGDEVVVRFGHPQINGWVVPGCNAGNYVHLNANGAVNGLIKVEYLEDAAYLTLHAVPLSPSMQAFTVPPGQVFVMGDNRNHSNDSRALNGGRGGGFSASSILGRVERLLFGVKRSGELDANALLQPIDSGIEIESIDASALRASVERCLRERPKQTRPPRKQEKDESSSASDVVPANAAGRDLSSAPEPIASAGSSEGPP